jgi:hypothetical protein
VWRRREPPLDRATVNGIILKLMQIDEKLDRIIELVGGEDAEEDEP